MAEDGYKSGKKGTGRKEAIRRGGRGEEQRGWIKSLLFFVGVNRKTQNGDHRKLFDLI